MTTQRASRNDPMTPQEGRSRARFLRQVRERMSAEINGLENGTLVVLNDGSPRTPADVAGALGVTQQGANNMLAALFRAGLVERSRVPVPGGGRAYAYALASEENSSTRADEPAVERGARALAALDGLEAVFFHAPDQSHAESYRESALACLNAARGDAVDG